MCTSHQPGSVTRFHMAIVAIMVLLLFVTAVITGTCSISSEGNMLRHRAPAPAHTISQATQPRSMAGCMPGCPMHQTPCAPTSDHHHGAASCILCAPSELPVVDTAPAPPTGASVLAAVTYPGLATVLPVLPDPASPNPPPPSPPLSSRPSSLRV